MVVPDFRVWEENWRPLMVFLAMQTQWEINVGMSAVIYQGLRYSALESVLRLEQIPQADWPEVFRDIRTMEAAVLPMLNAKA